MTGWRLYLAETGFPQFAKQWDQLNRALFRGHPLLDSLFVGPLVEHFRTPHTYLAVLGDPSAPTAMMLLDRSRFGIWSTFLPSQSQIAPMLMHGRDAASLLDLMRALPGHVPALDLLSQDPLYSGVLGSLDAEGIAGLAELQPHVRTISARLDGGFDAYWAARSRALVKNIRRYGNRVEREGLRFEFEVATSVEHVLARVDDYGRLESSGWKGVRGTAINPGNVQGHFYSAVMRSFAQRGDARVYSLLHDGRVVGSRLVICSHDMMVILKTTYDEAYRRYAVGWLLLYEVLRHAFECNAGRVVEFYTNATEEQLAWATDDRVMSNVRIHRSSGERWALEQARGLRRLVRRVAGRSGHQAVQASDPAEGGPDAGIAPDADSASLARRVWK